MKKRSLIVTKNKTQCRQIKSSTGLVGDTCIRGAQARASRALKTLPLSPLSTGRALVATRRLEMADGSQGRGGKDELPIRIGTTAGI